MKKLPVGIDDFRKIRENDYYYVDKTNLIRDIIDNGSEVTLFTRPWIFRCCFPYRPDHRRRDAGNFRSGGGSGADLPGGGRAGDFPSRGLCLRYSADALRTSDPPFLL